MSIIKRLTTLAVTLVLVACGGSGSGFATDPTVDPTDPTVTPVSAVTVLASSPTMQSDNSQSLTISVIVRDE
ncbi:MAG: hypothetical protein RIA65_04085, partial [Woeseia sp.]